VLGINSRGEIVGDYTDAANRIHVHHRVRCYVQQDALIEPARGLREDADVYQRCLLAYDHHRDLIQAAARRLIEAKVGALDGVVVVSSAALALQAEAPLAALDSAR